MKCYSSERTGNPDSGAKVFILLFLTLMVLPVNLSAQEKNVRFERIGVEQGLSSNTVICILQDSQGFMWFGTDDGLNKFNGYDFTIYRHDSSDQNSLSHKLVWAIIEDSKGILWIGTNNGLNKFNRKSERFTRYLNMKETPRGAFNYMVRFIFEDSVGSLWVGIRSPTVGLIKFDRKSETFIRYQHQVENPHSISDNVVLSIFEDSSGTLWIGTRKGLNKFDRESDDFTFYQYEKNNQHGLSNIVISIFEDPNGDLLIGGFGRFYKFDRNTENFCNSECQMYKYTKGFNPNSKAFFKDCSGAMWIGTTEGLIKFERNAETFSRFSHQSDNPYSLSSDFAISIFEDAGGNLWIGTEKGINKLNRNPALFNRYQHSADNPNSLSQNKVTSILEDSGGIVWVGTEEGLNRFDRRQGTFTHYKKQADNRSNLSHNWVTSIFEDSGGTLWIGTKSGLNKFNRKRKTFSHYKMQADKLYSLSRDWVSSIYEDSSGNMWIGTWGGGLNKFDKMQETFTRYQYRIGVAHSLSSPWVTLIFEDSGGTLWVGTDGGLNRFDKKADNFIRYQPLDDNYRVSIHKLINSIFEDSSGTFWIVDEGGLSKFDRKEGIYKKFWVSEDFPHDKVNDILEDDKGILWLSADKWLCRFDPKKGTFSIYDERDGIICPVGRLYKGKSGRIYYYGGGIGFVEFSPGQIEYKTYYPPVVVTDFSLFNKSVSVAKKISESDGLEEKTGFVLPQHINFTREVVLDYADNMFALEFSALDYRRPERNQYAYKLDGYDKDWINTDSKNRKATYTRVPPGDYTFRVKASNSYGYWSEKETTLKITILPPWWKTWWAYTLYTLVILGVITWYVWSQKRTQRKLEHKVQERTQQLSEANKKLKELDQIKTDYLSFASHELRTPLTSVLGFARIIKKRLDQKIFPVVPTGDDKTSKAVEQVSSNIDIILSEGFRLTELINNVLDIAKMEAGKMEWKKETVSITSVLESAVEATAGLFENKPFKMTLEIQDSLPDIQGDRGRLIQVFINLISNAVKFTEKGTVTCSARCIEKLICISVTDTGTGIAQEDLPKLFEKYKQAGDTLKDNQKGTGLGLPICKQIVEYHGGTITIESQLNKGTTVTVKLPECE